MKIHKKALFCGSAQRETTEENSKVTCKRCLRLLADSKPNKIFRVNFREWSDLDPKLIEAPTSSKAIYKYFKLFYYEAELCENIGEQFQWFRKAKPKTEVIKDKDAKQSLTWREEQEEKEKKAQEKADEFNRRNPLGTEVLFQADFTEEIVVTKTKSAAFATGENLLIFLHGVSGSYLLDERFIRVLTKENKSLSKLRD